MDIFLLHCVVLIAKWPQFSWRKHPSWAAVLVGPCAYGLVQTADPAWSELFCHIGVPRIQHFRNFPKAIPKGWRLM